MTSPKPGIIFMGTPDFAVPSLEILIKYDYPVKAVVTAVDKPAGRGLKVRESAVKHTALTNQIPVLQPSNLKDVEFLRKLHELSADIFVVVAFRMLPKEVWSIPPMGTINLHASLLPLYRGAAPINHAIINGEKITGVTTFIIEKEIDKGQILFQEKTEIADNETAGTLHEKLMLLGSELLFKTLVAMAEDRINPQPQDKMVSTQFLPSAPKISKSDCRIEWSASVGRIYDFVRGLSPYPAAWTTMVSGDKSFNIRIFEVEKQPGSHSHVPGTVLDYKSDFVIAAGGGYVTLKKIQAEGKKAMSSSEFLKGFRPDTNPFCR